MKVELLTCSDSFYPVCAARRCYSAKSGDDLTNEVGAMSNEDMASFLSKLKARGHLSPFEHGSATFAIDGLSRVALAQLTRHRHLSFCVQSSRYTEADGEMVMPATVAENEKARDLWETSQSLFLRTYRNLLALGVPKQDARMVLPQAQTCNLVVTGNFRAWLEFLPKRQDQAAQWEIRELANEIGRLLAEAVPEVFGEVSE